MPLKREKEEKHSSRRVKSGQCETLKKLQVTPKMETKVPAAYLGGIEHSLQIERGLS